MTDEWMVTSLNPDGTRRRLILHERGGIIMVAERAETLLRYYGEKIISIVNQEEKSS